MLYQENGKNIVVLVPYPAQGHVTPMLQLASAFVSRGFKPIVILPEFLHRRIDHEDEIRYVGIPDGLQEGGPHDFFSIERAMENFMPMHFERVLRDIQSRGEGGIVACMVVDLLASWAIKVAVGMRVKVVGFWPVMRATYQLIASIPHLLRTGVISDTGIPKYKGPMSISPDHSNFITTEDLPWLIGTSGERASRFKFWTRTLERSKDLNCLLVNTFPQETHGQYKLHNDHQYYIRNIVHVGPLDKWTVKGPVSFWDEDMSCLDWLDKQLPSSVLYVSFGSWVSSIGEAKIRSLALALEALERPFIWVLNPSWRQGLPSSFLQGILTKKAIGKVVAWAPQMEVLRHVAVGCYLSHCGWNSTLEAIQCKKPIMCYPVAGDQFMNCAYIVKVWEIGVRILGLGLKDIEQGLTKIMGDCKVKERLARLNEKVMGKEAILVANRNLADFVHNIN